MVDRELIVRAARGDERAVSDLYDRYGGVLYAIAFRVTREAADAEEVVLEAFAQAWRKADSFESERGSVAAWLTTITRNRALDAVRARTRRYRTADLAQAHAEHDSVPAHGSWRPDPTFRVQHDERRRYINAALSELAEPQREVIELAYFSGLTQSEIALRLDQPLGTVKTRIRLGMEKLRESLHPYFFDEQA